jgi:hypothetical protein
LKSPAQPALIERQLFETAACRQRNSRRAMR